MPADLDTIRAMLESLYKDTLDALDSEIQLTNSEFSKSNRFHSSGRRTAIGKRAQEVFRNSANTMATKARHYAGNMVSGVDALVDQTLRKLIDTILSSYLADGWDANLQPELIRLKDAAVRDLQCMPSDQPIGMSITVSGNTAPVNLSAGQNNSATQTITDNTATATLTTWLALVRDATARSNLAEVDRADVIDQVDVVDAEVGKPSPDQGKLVRWAKRLLDTVEKVGISVTSTAISGWLKSHGIG